MTKSWVSLALGMAMLSLARVGHAQERPSPIVRIIEQQGVTGGLCVQLGSEHLALALDLGRTGRMLIEILDPDPAKVERARKQVQTAGAYGLVSANRWASGTPLPYAENLVNLLVIEEGQQVPLAEAVRVLRPGGVILAEDVPASVLKQAGLEDVQRVGAGGDGSLGRKPWPAEMDEWSHPRYGPGGNPVSADQLVGPTRRVRWLAGPLVHASNIVTAGGRFYYHGIMARDAFNGLLLWDRKLETPPSRIDSSWHGVRGSVLPVASADRFFVVEQGQLQALDPATGKTIQVYTAAGTPIEFLHIDGSLVTTDAKTSTVRAIDAESGNLLWSYTAVIPVTSMVADEGGVYFYEGGQDFLPGNHLGLRRRREAPEPRSIVKLDLATGQPAWRLAEVDHPWATKGKRLSVHLGFVVCELSRFTNNPAGNAIQVLAAGTGKPLWQREYVPRMNHRSQARALHVDALIWISNTYYDERKRRQSQWLGLDPATGKTVTTHNTDSFSNCTPPVATERFFLRGLSLTDIGTGESSGTQLTKHSCSLDVGGVPGNGLIYIAPKHCTCFPMLKSYVAMAPATPRPGAAARTPVPSDFHVERGPAFGQVEPAASADADEAWPAYRADLWRSASSATTVPAQPELLWTTALGDWPEGPLADDWKENPGVRGPITPPVAAGGRILVAQPDRHRVVAMDAETGKRAWDFTADGRVDTPPSLASGLCLFGTRNGTVYALRAKDGQLAWRLRVTPENERIVAFGHLESPWPASGSVLVVGNTTYVAAGRHPLAFGGIRILALETTTGAVKWVTPIGREAYDRFKKGQGLEVDMFDLLVGEACRVTDGSKPSSGEPDYITMGRWQIDPASGELGANWDQGFNYCRTGGVGVMAPRGLWTYGPRVFKGHLGYLTQKRPLAAFRNGTIYTSSDDLRSLSRVDFTPESIAAFGGDWHSHRQKIPRITESHPKKHGRTDYWLLRAHEEPNNTTWTATEVFGPADTSEPRLKGGGYAWTPGQVHGGGRGLNDPFIGAVVVAGDTVFVAGTHGRLVAYAVGDGRKLAERALPPVVWDGMAAAYGRLFVSTADGKVLALGRK